MDYKGAIELLNPDTSRDAIWKISDEENAIKKIEEALVMACEAMKELQEYKQLGTLEEVCKAVDDQDTNFGKWIPADRPPEPEKYVLLSFSNYFSVPVVGMYRVDDCCGGGYCIGDGDEYCISQELFVNAWMQLPKPYRGGQDE